MRSDNLKKHVPKCKGLKSTKAKSIAPLVLYDHSEIADDDNFSIAIGVDSVSDIG